MDHLTEKTAQYIPHPATSKREPMIREPELKLEGRFECQPEYRKAYIDYLIRERLDRKPRPLDNLSTDPKRALDVVNAKPNATMETTLKQDTTNIKKEVDGGTKIVENELQRERPLKSSTKNKSKSLSRIESSVFGPKLQVPSQTPQGSRAPTPTVTPSSRRGSTSVTVKVKSTTSTTRRSGSRFGSPVRVENLACRSQAVSPVPPKVESTSTRRRWQNREANVERSRAFIVLEQDGGEINNNCKKSGGLYKEQKWMSPWYNPSS